MTIGVVMPMKMVIVDSDGDDSDDDASDDGHFEFCQLLNWIFIAPIGRGIYIYR